MGSESGKLMTLALDKVRNMPMANIREEQGVHLIAHGTSGGTTDEDISRWKEVAPLFKLISYTRIKSRTPENEKGVL